jgi:hypothetical protein
MVPEIYARISERRMKTLSREDLYTLEDYAEARPRYRAQVMAHKKNRQVAVGPHATLYFEDRLTIQYQVQEMLRIERIFERGGIDEELAAYNPLIPDGSNLKATFMLEYDDVEERRRALAELTGIESRVWLGTGAAACTFAIADEDLERATDDKTSAVHFLRFELDAWLREAIIAGAPMAIGIDHDHYRHSVDPIPENVRAALRADLD